MMNSSPSDAFDPGTDYRRRRRNRLILCAGIVMGVLAIGSGLFVAFGTGKGKNKGITDVQAEALRTELASAMTEQGLDPKRLTIATAYQSKAMEWLLTNEDILSYDTSQKLQRFVLACFYYATNGIITLYTPKASGWLDSTGWLTDISECDWKGVQCSEKKKVNAISLENNGLTGAIPKELIFLQDHITSLDLTTNLLYMSGPEFDVFKSLARLETLLLDDNYLLTTDGLPLSFTTLTSLKKLRLSYNLFGGTITAKMVKSWPKLTHLEIESNFLEGPLPTTLGDLDQLVYLYVRRNSLSLNLDFLKSGKMSNLFAMWLDNNVVTGGIPTEIGTMTELASISITNSSLTGTIPSELGKLVNLRRLWLYDNDLKGTIPTQMSLLTALEVFEVQKNALSGTMPSGICTAVNGATYESYSLLADCSSVSCIDCCTTC